MHAILLNKANISKWGAHIDAHEVCRKYILYPASGKQDYDFNKPAVVSSELQPMHSWSQV
jgi:hypothetical protein